MEINNSVYYVVELLLPRKNRRIAPEVPASWRQYGPWNDLEPAKAWAASNLKNGKDVLAARVVRRRSISDILFESIVGGDTLEAV